MLDVTGVTKAFGSVVACDDVSMQVRAGEIRGLLGQNGAGKSTLMKIVAGLVRPERGEVRVEGQLLAPGDPQAANAAGVGMVHQHFSLVGPLRVWENVTLGEIGHLDEQQAVHRVRGLGERYGLEVDPYARVLDLTPGERQRVEIIKCLRRDPKVIILDEPTSVLSHAESQRLFEVLTSLVRDEQRAVVLISHRLEDVLAVADRITVLRDGRTVSTCDVSQTDVNRLASEMLGRAVALHREAAAIGLSVEAEAPAPLRAVPSPGIQSPQPVLEITDATVLAPDGHKMLDGLSLCVRAGEVLGVAGVEGNGQAALADVLAGLVRLDAGTVRIAGKPMRTGRGRNPDEIGIVPADRHGSGCVLQLSVAENLVLSHPESIRRFGLLSRRAMARHARQLVRDFNISTPSVFTPLWALSGGNQQRVVLARELSMRPKVLVVSQPTQGLDVGAMEDIWDRLRRSAERGVAVLLISTDLDEILAVADRIAVIFRGRIVGEMARDAFDEDRLGLLMGGSVVP